MSLTPPPRTTDRADTLSQNRDPSVRADREPESVPAQATVGRFLPDEHGAAGHRAHRRNGQGTPVRSSYTRSSSQKKAPTLQARTSCEPTDQNATQRSAAASHPTNPNPPANPPIKPLSPAQAPPARTRKSGAPPPATPGPAPAATTCISGRGRSVPGGSRSEDDPCLGLRRQPTGGACSFYIIRHRCDKVNTLVGGSGGFFCHSVI